MVDNPNSVLQSALVGKTITSHVRIEISTNVQVPQQFPPVAVQAGPDVGGGTANIAFLAGTGHGPNAKSVQVDAIFWISHYTDQHGPGVLLQYSQIVLLNFAPLSWPHVSVANLTKQVDKNTKDGKDTKDGKSEVKDHKPEIKDHKPEVKENIKQEAKELETKQVLEVPVPGPGPVIGAQAAHAGPQPDPVGRPFIQLEERPVVGDAAIKNGDTPKKGS